MAHWPVELSRKLITKPFIRASAALQLTEFIMRAKISIFFCRYRVMVLNNVVAFLLFLGQVVIVVGVGCLAYFGNYVF